MIDTLALTADDPRVAATDEVETPHFGGDADDRFVADGAARNIFYGGAGDDWLTIVSENSDEDATLFTQNTFDGGDGRDMVALSFFYGWYLAPTIDLSQGFITFADPRWPRQTLVSVEDAYGSDSKDILIGSEGANLLDGGDNNDTLSGGGGDDSLFGGWYGRDLVYGGDGDDVIDGGGDGYLVEYDDDTLDGGAGDDLIIGNSMDDLIYGGAGDDAIHGDWVVATDNPYFSDDWDGFGIGDNTLYGGAGDDALYGGAGNDTLEGGEGRDSLYGGEGDDLLDGGTELDLIDGGAGVDTVAASGDQAVRINLALNRLSFPGTVLGFERLASIENATGGSGNDFLTGTKGVNVLRGRLGDDRLTGGAEADILVGGPGFDVFEFLAVSDSAPGQADRIEAGNGGSAFFNPGAAVGDLIDLSGIDANLGLAGDQAFQFGTSRAVGRIWLVEFGSNTHVRGNVAGDAAHEFDLILADAGVRAASYTAADFVL